MSNRMVDYKGFTLIELMIVVAIIGILAAIAIPSFLQFQLKTKTAEARANLGTIKTSQASFRAENNFYATCTLNPAVISGQGSKQAWGVPLVGAGWREIGFSPTGNIYYLYEVISSNDNGNVISTMAANMTGVDYAATAIADLDMRNNNGEFGYATNDLGAAGIPVNSTTSAFGTITKINEIQNLAPDQF